MGEMKLESIRSMNDFLLDSARFQLPGGGSWGKRVKGNLLYYQTNYAIISLIIVIIILLMRPAELLTGVVVGVVGGIVAHFATQRFVNEFRVQHPYVMSGGALVLVYLLLSLLGSVAIFALAILLPIFCTLVHASLRTRNTLNKIRTQVDKAGLKKTPMGTILDQWGFVFDDE